MIQPPVLEEKSMRRAAGAAALMVLFIFAAQPVCLAASAKLLGMTNSRQENMSRIDFVFDRIPEFEVDQSGQRIQVRLEETVPARSFEAVSRHNLLEPLVEVKHHSTGERCVVDLYFRDIPEYVDVAVEKGYGRFHVNVFWEEQERARRPGVLGKRMGRLKPINGGAVAEQVLASEYAGDWRRFFRDFEWEPVLDLPLRFSLPAFPGPMFRENAHFFHGAVKSAGAQARWSEAAAELRRLLEGNAGGRQRTFFQLLLAQCRLRQNRPEAALEVLHGIHPASDEDPIAGWRAYLASHAMAASGKPFRAARLLSEQQERCLAIKPLAPWLRLLAAEIDLSLERPESALERLQEAETKGPAGPGAVQVLRRADANSAMGRYDAATPLYAAAAEELQNLRQHPASLARRAVLFYRQEAYEKAFQDFFLLSEVLPEALSNEKRLAAYWSAMALVHTGDKRRARTILNEIVDADRFSEAGCRARLKLMDLDRLSGSAASVAETVSGYELLVEKGPAREVREEAFFKKILVRHLAGEHLRTVKQLGRFFDDFWAGPLMPEAQALLVDVFPQAVHALVEDEAFLEALILVSKYRGLLAQARITYGFLFDLAESYSQAGFYDQAASTYHYILDFEEEPQKKQAAYLPLIRIHHRQKKYDQVLRFGREYLERYPKGQDRGAVIYYYADVLFKKGRLESASRMLAEERRPKTLRLDYLAGRVFRALGRNDRAEYYLTWAADADRGGEHPGIRYELGEVLFADEKWREAVPVYSSLLEEPRFAGRAGYRLIQIHLELGRRREALKVYERLSENKPGGRWAELAGEAVRIGRMQ